MKFLIFISFLYIFCFCQVSLANESSDIVIKRGSVLEEMFWNDLQTRIQLLLDDPKSVENLSDDSAIVSLREVDVFLVSRMDLLHQLFPQTAEDLLVDLLNNHSNRKVQQLAAYLMGSWYGKQVLNDSRPAVVTSLLNSMEGSHWLVRVEAAKALGSIGEGYSQLIYWLENETNSEVRLEILDSLHRITTANINSRLDSSIHRVNDSIHPFVHTLVQLAKNDNNSVIRTRIMHDLKDIVINFSDTWNLKDGAVALDCLIEISSNQEEEQSMRTIARNQLIMMFNNDLIKTAVLKEKRDRVKSSFHKYIEKYY